MNAISKNSIENLQNNQTVIARWGRAGQDSVQWNEWQEVDLYIQRDQYNKICVIALQNINWAEYNPDDYYEDTFLTEDYYLQILEPDPQIYITVEGGVVQSICHNIKNLEINIIDLDEEDETIELNNEFLLEEANLMPYQN